MDKLNNIVKERSMPFEQYFGEMDLPKAEKEKRIKQAQSLEDFMLEFFAHVGAILALNFLDRNSLSERLFRGYFDWLSANNEIDDYLLSHAYEFTDEVLSVTLEKGITDNWFTSEDRATFIAENEANLTGNYLQWKNAVARGKTKKTWVTMRDRRVRKTHAEISGNTIPINEPFVVGNELLMFPKDTSLGGYAEVANCRCLAKYS